MTAGPSDQAAVRVRGLRKTFSSFGVRQEVLRGIDLDVARGEVVGLIGPNGAGKTTLMSCLLGFLFVDDGELSIDGQAVDDLRVRARTGFVPERMNFDRHVSGGKFLLYMARLAGLRGKEAERRTAELMVRMQIDHAADRRLSQYSRGMLQRIALCQALMSNPDFLFLDEPSSGLDPSGVLLVRDVILEEKRRGAAVLMNSHQLSEVEKVCDRVLFLSGGAIAQQEALRPANRIEVSITTLLPLGPDSVIHGFEVRREGDRSVVAVVESEHKLADLVKAIVDSGAGVVEVRRVAVDLEKMFREEA
jgi:ABC-2 type transport system ATP-binding protein